MPLREDLLTPIAGENPAGEDLYYDKVFDQIKEARREEEDDLPAGDWGRSQVKKADHRAVIKLAGEALGQREARIFAWPGGWSKRSSSGRLSGPCARHRPHSLSPGDFLGDALSPH
jgi:hypothetical protein